MKPFNIRRDKFHRLRNCLEPDKILLNAMLLISKSSQNAVFLWTYSSTCLDLVPCATLSTLHNFTNVAILSCFKPKGLVLICTCTVTNQKWTKDVSRGFILYCKREILKRTLVLKNISEGVIIGAYGFTQPGLNLYLF